jgi:hypothetical protein
MREGWLWDDDAKEYVPIDYDELDPEVLAQLRAKPTIGGFVYRAEDFLHLPLVTAPFYVAGGWLPRQGKTLFYAPGKSGKSFFALQLARCIASEEEFLGLKTTQGRVLYLQFEMGLEILQSRMRETKQDYTDVFVGTSFSMKLDKDAGQKQMLAAMQAVKPQVVILDPWYKIISGDDNEAQDTEKITDFLDSVIEMFDCSVVIFDHTGKDQSRGARGSSVKEGWVDSYIQIKKVGKKGEPLKIQIIPQLLRHAELPPVPVVAEFGEDFEFEQVEAVDELAPTVYELIRDYIKKEEITHAKDIESQKFGSRTQVNRALNKLLGDGLIIRSDRGVYEWNKKK